MSNIIDKLKEMDFVKSALSDDIQVADISARPFEVKILFYAEGTIIPAHTHSTDTLHIVLDGAIEVDSSVVGEKRIYKAAEDYECGGWEYRGVALADTYVMLIQTPGTSFVKSKD